ncbi:pimeloyl-ACP methyl ester carboxylesterase [Sphingomonas jejuensis]|uniref:Pimeloyl-ACP methyl ester carboxylesterase n=1 Tax=Sphingomonas jejuensis TaxID=904715 RepID=A0ABX0XJK0_9SPHN|nr:pimeloyl-ACP methyl ester carboxylesterase [Sphingomonas jejuensis]
MSEPAFFHADDGTRLAYRELGTGRPVVLIHGFVSDANTNWIRYGHAAAIAERGFRVIMPDLRAHGSSDRPHDPAAYPPDVLTDDGFALVRQLGLTDYDLGGYSLGARTTVRMLARGATPRRVVIAGMGLEGIADAGGRSGHFRNIFNNLGSFPKFSAAWNVEAFLKTTGGDPVALNLLLNAFTSSGEDVLRSITQPTLVVAGREDDEVGSFERLAEVLPHATRADIPGGHMSAVTKPELGEAIAAFLAD